MKSQKIVLLTLFLALLQFESLPLSAGDVTGKVTLNKPVDEESVIISRALIRRYAGKHVSHEPSGGEDYEQVVVFFEDAAPPPDYRPESVAKLDQVGQTFIPHVLPIVVGTKVQFPNNDTVYHNVFSFSEAKTFDLGRYPTGKSRSVTFSKPGVVKVYCDIHPHMSAFILVLKNPYFARCDKNGNFVIKDVPAGRFKLNVWYGRLPDENVEIIVPESGQVEKNLTFP
jgi:plastocyanin